MNEKIIQDTVDFIKREFQHDSSGHDWWHIYRVWKMSLVLAEHEGADETIVQLAALLHDLDDWKLNPAGDDTPVRAIAWMEKMSVEAETRVKVTEIISHLSFKGANVENQVRTLEGKVVQDADRLDAIGAIGIGRAFAYGGHKGRSMYDPGQPPQLHDTFEQYKASQSDTLNHFYEKLLLLKDRLNTPTARKIAEGRHQFMQEFVERFLREWDALDI